MSESFDVFLSHNSKDKPAVREVGLTLRARGLRVWLDEWELIPGRPWLDALERVIETIGCAVVLVGKDGLGPWEDREMRACLSEFVSRGLPVIPVLLPGAPDKPALPLLLRQFTWVDLRAGLTDEGVDRLLWGITGRKPETRPAKVAEPQPPVAVPETKELAASGQPFTEPLTGIRFLWIPGGRFQMGGSASPREQPVHWVQLSPFWLAETPVTNRQYAMFLEKTGSREPDYWRDKRFSALEQPVVGVSWDDAQEFCSWLSEVSGRRVLLPSEAQWEFAARGTDGREYPWGNEPPDGARACFDLDVQKGQPSPVGLFPAGPFGTLDQAGNVWEWCRDAWDAEAYSKPEYEDEAVDPILEVKDAERQVLRGGGWISSAEFLRAAFRYWFPAWLRYVVIGFRVAAVPARISKP